VEYASPYVQELTSYEPHELVGERFLEKLIPAEDRAGFDARLREIEHGQPLSSCPQPLLDKSGRRLWLLWTAREIALDGQERCILVVGHDVTELKQAQSRAVQAERLAAIGQMMTGLAHESRNALQRSQACLGMLARRVANAPELLELIAGIQEAQYDLGRLYESVRSYAAPLNLRLQTVDVSRVLEEAWSHLETERRNRDARLELVKLAENLVCQADAFTIEQVFRNLLENCLSLCHDPVRIEARFMETNLEGFPALLVLLSDNGPGFSVDAQQHIFEPFFTTKIHGSGLGMPIAKRIVDAHRGELRLASPQPPSGAQFEMLLRRRVD
jgi:PAS domain S-box-containing protein